MSDHKAEEANKDGHGNCVNKNSKEDVSSSVCSGHFKKYRVPRTGGSILNLMDELVKVGQVMGYKMDGCLAQKAKKDWVKELCVKNKVNFMALQETKMENMELFSVNMCWGNFAFDYVHSDSGGEVVIMGDFNERLAVEILVLGFVFKERDLLRPWEGQTDNMERYALQWEYEHLYAVSTAIQDWLSSTLAMELMRRGAMMTVLNDFLSAFACLQLYFG
ncbi:RNA-directed DNA polymerase, eukaryota [Tanacetum coccineum]